MDSRDIAQNRVQNLAPRLLGELKEVPVEIMDLNEVVSSKLTGTGVEVVTVGTIACNNVRGLLRSLLKTADAEGYAEYRALKYPAGGGSDTPESRVAATRFLFDRARDLLVPHYVSASASAP